MESILIGIDSFFTLTLGQTLFFKAATLIAGIRPLFSLGFAIYIILLTFHYYKRGFDDSIVDISKNVIGWLVIIALAFNVANYAKVAAALYSLPSDLSAWVTGTQLDSSTLGKSFLAVQQLMAKIYALGDEASSFDFITPLVAGIVSILCGLFGVVVVLFTYIYYLIAKTTLALVLLIGPLFIGAMLFPATRQYGMNWIGQILNSSVLIALNALVSTLLLSYVEGIISQFAPETMTIVVVLNILIGMFLFTIISIVVTLNIPSVASALTGGATASTQARDISHAGRMLKAGISKFSTKK